MSRAPEVQPEVICGHESGDSVRGGGRPSDHGPLAATRAAESAEARGAASETSITRSLPWPAALASSPGLHHSSILLRQGKMNEKKIALIVSGMHRSGTSSIAGVVGMLGASLPQNLLPPNFDNPLGFFESDKVMRLNDKILSESGSSLSDWRAVNNEWQKNPNFNSYLSEASLILTEEFGASNFIV